MNTYTTHTFKQWMNKNFNSNELQEIGEKGADLGWNGITYYSETSKLYDRYEDEIWQVLATMADDAGFDGPVEFLCSCRYAREAMTPDQFKTSVVWLTAEYYAVEISNLPEDETTEED